jgi:predicted O-methyltransferase YrrM
MRGPLLSGPLGSARSLDAILRWLDRADRIAVIGPLWMAEALSSEVSLLLLIEPEERQRARRVVRRARTAGHRLIVVLAGVDLPLAQGTIDTLLIESASTLEAAALARWLATLVPLLRSGGRLIAVDATGNPAAEARLAGQFLGAALTEIVQERPRDGVVLTVGLAPATAVVTARFGMGENHGAGDRG